MGAEAMTTDKDSLTHWLKTVQITNLIADDVMSPARISQPIGNMIKDAKGGEVFDTEPAAYYKLLRDLAPETNERD